MITKHEVMEVKTTNDVVRARQMARSLAVEAGFSLVDQTKIVTAVSELARNTVVYAGGGRADFELIEESNRRGLRIVFRDQGPGIADVELALRDGYTTSGGLGLGLGGARRLANDFEITSSLGRGTTVSITRWKQPPKAVGGLRFRDPGV